MNFDQALLRSIALTEGKTLQFRLETFNTFNHSQFFGPAAVNGDFGTGTFGHVVKSRSAAACATGPETYILIRAENRLPSFAMAAE